MEQFLKDVEDLVGGTTAKDKDGDAQLHPYAMLEKSHVLQEARIFHDSTLVRENPRKCCTILAQILYLQNDTGTLSSSSKSSSSKLTRIEATELFFSATKLFVSPDASLRRLVYLFIKEIQPLCDPSDVIIVTSCLTKDMTCDVGLYRANAIRVLVNIIDSAMLGSIERYIKQAIVDNDAQVSNSALVSAAHLFEQSTDNATIVRRWIGEVQATLSSKSSRNKQRGTNQEDMVQVNAMRLLCQMKGHDRLGMAKLVQQFSGQAGTTISSPLALVILIRVCGKLLKDELNSNGSVPSRKDIKDVSSLCKLGFEFLESSLSHPSHMVSYEAAKTICALPTLDAHNYLLAIECLKKMLVSDLPASRFASVKTLSELGNRHPRAVARCNEGLEAIMDDRNKSIATMAVTTLLKTGNEQSIDRVLKIILMLFADTIQDEFKITVISSLQELCLRYPQKHNSLVSFMANFLKEEGGFEFKRSIIQSIVALMRVVPETTESSLYHLCEFIEDCEYRMLSTQTMHIIAELGPKTSEPSRYIRFLYNRVILETSVVRAAAVSALTKFASRCPSLRVSIVALLKCCCLDADDEVRDRASVAVNILQKAMKEHPYIAPNIDDYDVEDIPPDVPADGDSAAYAFLECLPFSFHNLERSIKAYTETPVFLSSPEPLTLTSLPLIEDAIFKNDVALKDDAMSPILSGLSEIRMAESSPLKEESTDPAAAVYAIPDFASLGRVFRSTTPIALTEDETEYVVKCIKHILDNHVILQFTIHNTVEDQQMENVVVSIEFDANLYEIIGDVPAEKIKYGNSASCFAVLQRNQDQPIISVDFECHLDFTVVQVEPESGEPISDGYSEEYPLEVLHLTPSDFILRVPVLDFRKAWNKIEYDSNEALQKFSLQYKNLGDAVLAVIEFLGMVPCDGTGQPPSSSSGSSQHMLHLSGIFVGGNEVLVRAQLTSQMDGTLLKIAVRSNDKNLSEAVLQCIK